MKNEVRRKLENIRDELSGNKNEVVIRSLKRLIEREDKILEVLEKLPSYLEKLKKIEIDNFPTETAISNFPEEFLVKNFPDEIKITKPKWYKEPLEEIKIKNFSEFPKIPEHPKKINIESLPAVDVKQPKWWKAIDLDGLWSKLSALLESLSNKIFTIKFKEPQPVRMVDEKGKPVKMIQGGGGGVVVTGGGSDPVGLKNVAGTKINPATQDTLAQVLTELQQKTEPTDTQLVDASKSILKKTVLLAASGTVIAPASGKKIRLFNVKFSLSADMTDISLRWTAGGTDFEKYLSPKAGGLYGTNNHPDYIEGGADQVLYCNIAGSGNVQINIDYLEI